MSNTVRWTSVARAAGVLVVLGLAACGGADTNGTGRAEFVADTIEIAMITDDSGNYFEPSEVAARPGDVLRVELVSGVHNFHIPEDTNPNANGLPEPSPMLQLPGQTWEWTVDLSPGVYAFQCDPHAALGMVGNLTVTN